MINKIKENIVYDVIIIGFGVASISSAIYSIRKGLKTAIIGTKIGGQVIDTLEIENIIGIKHITGQEFSKNVYDHLSEYDVDVKEINVKTIIDKKDNKVIVTTDGKEYLSKTCIIATGAVYKKLNIEGEQEYIGKGVHYCSTCDGPFYKGLDVAVIGGGNSGVEAALELNKIAKSVVLLEFEDKLKADKILQDKLKENNIKVILNAKANKISGQDFVTKLEYIDRKTNNINDLNVDGVFVEIGLRANTDFVKDLVKMNKYLEIEVDKNNHTSVEGIFAAGDCTDSKYKQIVISIGQGANAALSVFSYLQNKN